MNGKTHNKEKGKLGEELAVEYIKKLGIKIINTNWRYSRCGEIDIIAMDKDTLAFIEVKSRTSCAFGQPIEAIDERKMNQIRKIAQAFLHENPDLKYKNLRFDAVSVMLSAKPEIKHYKNFYQF